MGIVKFSICLNIPSKYIKDYCFCYCGYIFRKINGTRKLPPGKFPPRITPTRTIPIWEIPTQKIPTWITPIQKIQSNIVPTQTIFNLLNFHSSCLPLRLFPRGISQLTMR